MTPVRALLLFSFCLVSAAWAGEPAPVQVLVLGTFHMSNPGRDLHNQEVDDMRSLKRQQEIAAVTAALARFAPTRIAVEWPAKIVAERYPKYLDGTLPPSSNEVVQLGFRLGKLAKATVEGIDVEGDFPFEEVAAWAGAHGKKAEIDAMGAAVEREMAELAQALSQHGGGGELRQMNDPAKINRMHGAFYRRVLRYGSGDEQPGVNLLTAWYRRNFHLCANLAQGGVKPGDRIVVLYGSGHSYLLRQCVQEMPNWKLVEARAPNRLADRGERPSRKQR